MNPTRRAALTEEQALLVDVVQSLNARRLTEAARRIDHNDTIAEDVLAAIHQAGLFQLVLSTTDSPQDAALLSALVVNRMATASPAAAMLVGSAHAATVAMLAGDDSDRCTTLADGYRRLAFVDGAEDLTAHESNGWVVDRAVAACVGALGADAFVVIARGSNSQPMTFLIPRENHAVSVDPAHSRTGLRGAQMARIRFGATRLSTGSRVGGREAALAGTRHLALVVAAAAAGVADAAIEQARSYLHQRRQFGQALAKFAGLRAVIGEMAARRDAAWALTESAAEAPEALAHRAAAIASQAAVDIALDGVQLHGGYGYTQEFAIERCVRDAVSLRARAGGLRRHLAHSADDVLGALPRTDTTESFATAVEGSTR